MIKLLGSVPKNICVAVSGGLDSMSALHFLNNNTSRRIVALHFNHGTEHSDEAEEFVRDYCNKNRIALVVGRLSGVRDSNESKESFWRRERYSFFENWNLHVNENMMFNFEEKESISDHFCKAPIITCHHLDDAVETWIFTSLHGNQRLIPYKRGGFLRPFLLTRRCDFEDWANRNNVPHVFDPSNNDTAYMRNFIRHELMPNALTVNPGLHKVVYKKIKATHENYMDIF